MSIYSLQFCLFGDHRSKTRTFPNVTPKLCKTLLTHTPPYIYLYIISLCIEPLGRNLFNLYYKPLNDIYRKEAGLISMETLI